MNDAKAVKDIATQAQALEQRRASNAAAQEIDLGSWIFEHLSVPAGSRVLELCCGTGAQTAPLAQRTGGRGHVVALDVSRAALDIVAAKVGTTHVTLVESGLDELPRALESAGLQRPYFDLVFCAYGLYYSSDTTQTLDQVRGWLNDAGRCVVIGPYGPNNRPLYEILAAAGVVIPPVVRHSSESYMLREVMPWATEKFSVLRIHTLLNRVHWDSPEQVLEYWKNTTFYDADRLCAVSEALNAHFARLPRLTNEKWIMMVEMADARA